MKNQNISCPSCDVKQELKFHIQIKLSDTESDNFISSSIRDVGPIKCRSCQEHLSFRVALQIVSVKKVEKIEHKSVEDYFAQLPSAQRNLLKRWSENGLLDVLMDALFKKNPLEHVRHRTVQRFVIGFIKNAEVTWPHHKPVMEAANVDNADRVVCWEYNGITGLVVDGFLKSFVPSSLLVRANPKPFAYNGGGITSPAFKRLRHRTETEEGWIKTRFGYVVGRGELFDEISRHSYKRNSNVFKEVVQEAVKTAK